MNNEYINEQIIQNTVSSATLDFSDLMRRIEADGGRSTAPQMDSGRTSAGKAAGVAAGVVIVAALSTAAVAVMTSGGMAESDSAPVAEEAYDCAPEYSLDTEDFWYDEEAAPENENAAENETITVGTVAGVGNNMTGSHFGAASEAVSDSDVSDSDVSGSDADGE